MTEQVTQEVQNNDQIQETEAPQAPALGVQDLVSLLNIIQLTASRGAFRAEEFTEVGSVFERLRNFLISSGAISVNQPEQAAPAGEAQEPVTQEG